MTDPTTASNVASWVKRVVRAEPTRKGVAGAIAGFLIAVVSETLWPTNS